MNNKRKPIYMNSNKTTPQLQWRTRWIEAMQAVKATAAVVLLGTHAQGIDDIEQSMPHNHHKGA